MAKAGKNKGGKTKSSRGWSAANTVAAIAAAAVAKQILTQLWRASTGKRPPANPAHPDVEMREAVAWAVLSGTAIGVARMLASRRAADYYRRSYGHLPAGMERDDA